MVRLARLISGGALLLSSAAGPTFAAATESEKGSVLEEITVTAQKRSESLQNVPASVGTLTEAQLTPLASAGEDIRVLSGRVANLNVESTFGRVYPRLYIRGIGNEDFTLNAQQPVAMYYDEVVLENPVLKGMPPFDLERIEVLRGPQGTLWGKNTTAGAIDYVSRKPNWDSDGYFRSSYGRFNEFDAEGGMGGALVGDTLAGRASFIFTHRDGWITNTENGRKLEGYVDIAGRVQLLFRPSDRFDALLNFHVRSLKGDSTTFHAGIGETVRKDTVALDQPNLLDEKQWGAILTMKYALGSATLTSITAYEKGDWDSLFDI